ncbi:aspartic proteinase PCS1 [Amborella trichopoda]|uniref:Peptidase A1 domain-containing protein n=1 Tax=Amborella trichopoda TaxID=13333 RepID=W1PZR5_AMBTC|nr:aspartic proteinase PCS1 [Amborella trichopoda]ERN13923.1 hypothetical protein AMTR_s00021p00114200 [Amborella trichopoda]|eukprot:XP_006852456.3 aspartic proteinase PCS1 [Amborella trichopoda]
METSIHFFITLFFFISAPLPFAMSAPFTNLSLSFPIFYNSSQPSSIQPQGSVGTSFTYRKALFLSITIGTPPQTQPVLLDTGSELSWLLHSVSRTSAYNPSLSSSFSYLRCKNHLCKDFDSAVCGQRNRCGYSFSYADGTVGEGEIGTEVMALSKNFVINSLVFGVQKISSDPLRGILGLNRGQLSFISQSKVPKFSYCIPNHGSEGTFYIGTNPNSNSFRYTKLLTSNDNLPYFDHTAYTLNLHGIRLGKKRLPLERSVFQPDHTGAGQTIIDSGTQYSYMTGTIYGALKTEFMSQNVKYERWIKSGYVHEDVLDLCYEMNGGEVEGFLKSINHLFLEFGDGVEMKLGGLNLLHEVMSGIWCFTFGNSDYLGSEINIIGNHHQRNMWVEYDAQNYRLGFAPARC